MEPDSPENKFSLCGLFSVVACSPAHAPLWETGANQQKQIKTDAKCKIPKTGCDGSRGREESLSHADGQPSYLRGSDICDESERVSSRRLGHNWWKKPG